MGVRSRIFLYFLAFTALLLMLLWLFQIVLLDDFYRLQKTDMLKSSSQSIVQNINNENLDALVEVAAEEGYIKPEDKARLLKFRDNPSDESWMEK